METLKPGDPGVVGRYRLHARLGRSALGTVYLGRSPAPDRQAAAVTLIRPDLASEKGFRAALTEGVAAAEGVRGPRVASVLGSGVKGTPLWIAVKFTSAVTLQDAVREHGPLPEASLRALAVGLAEALSAVHAGGGAHGDLRPGRVLLTEDGPRTDGFGLGAALEMAGAGPRDDVPVAGADDLLAFVGVLCFAAGVEGPAELPDSLLDAAEACLAEDADRRPSAADLLELLGDCDEGAWLPDAVLHMVEEAGAAAEKVLRSRPVRESVEDQKAREAAAGKARGAAALDAEPAAFGGGGAKAAAAGAVAVGGKAASGARGKGAGEGDDAAEVGGAKRTKAPADADVVRAAGTKSPADAGADADPDAVRTVEVDAAKAVRDAKAAEDPDAVRTVEVETGAKAKAKAKTGAAAESEEEPKTVPKLAAVDVAGDRTTGSDEGSGKSGKAATLKGDRRPTSPASEAAERDADAGTKKGAKSAASEAATLKGDRRPTGAASEAATLKGSGRPADAADKPVSTAASEAATLKGPRPTGPAGADQPAPKVVGPRAVSEAAAAAAAAETKVVPRKAAQAQSAAAAAAAAETEVVSRPARSKPAKSRTKPAPSEAEAETKVVPRPSPAEAPAPAQPNLAATLRAPHRPDTNTPAPAPAPAVEQTTPQPADPRIWFGLIGLVGVVAAGLGLFRLTDSAWRDAQNSVIGLVLPGVSTLCGLAGLVLLGLALVRSRKPE